MSKLANIAEEAIHKTKFFQSHPKLHSRAAHNQPEPEKEVREANYSSIYQRHSNIFVVTLEQLWTVRSTTDWLSSSKLCGLP